ncbi:hypothetical protein CPC08DRAFT_823858 [Agrocybe pediades]|nr:hypothetical protein CPC08DRAFT_823858 [Agrocybe pediades]
MASSKRKPSEKVACDYCGEMYSARGMHRHMLSCVSRPPPTSDNLTARELADMEAARVLVQRNRESERGNNQLGPQGLSTGAGATQPVLVDRLTEHQNADEEALPDEEVSALEEVAFPHPQDPSPLVGNALPVNPDSDVRDTDTEHPRYAVDSIKIVTHPNTKIADKIYSYTEFCVAQDDASQSIHAFRSTVAESIADASERGSPINKPSDVIPWRPFRSRQDFELAELSLDTHMNNTQVNRLFNIIWSSIPEPAASNRSALAPASDMITLRTGLELDRTWDLARKTRASGFVEHSFTVPYKDRTLEYKVWVRPLWEWCEELLTSRDLSEQFHWDALQQYKYTKGGQWERFIDEPWTADAWWNFQTSIGAVHVDAKPFSVILYADKTRLSSFGTEKGYPVVVRCGNLPVSIRNNEGVGGSRLVGWLPIPEEVATDTGKAGYRNVKRLVWHEAVAIIFSSIQAYTHQEKVK